MAVERSVYLELIPEAADPQVWLADVFEDLSDATYLEATTHRLHPDAPRVGHWETLEWEGDVIIKLGATRLLQRFHGDLSIAQQSVSRRQLW